MERRPNSRARSHDRPLSIRDARSGDIAAIERRFEDARQDCLAQGRSDEVEAESDSADDRT